MRARATKADQDAQQKSGLANFLSSRRIWCECPQTTDAVEKLDLRRFRDLIGKFPGRTYGSKSLISRQCSSGKKGASPAIRDTRRDRLSWVDTVEKLLSDAASPRRPLSVFETVPFDRSGTSPRVREGQPDRWPPRPRRRPDRDNRRSVARAGGSALGHGGAGEGPR